jgi:hypothetical protein
MRKRIISGVVLALSGVVVLAVLNVNFLVRRNKDYLIGRVEQALGRKITVDKIEVTLIPVGARLVNFGMTEQPISDDRVARRNRSTCCIDRFSLGRRIAFVRRTPKLDSIQVGGMLGRQLEAHGRTEHAHSDSPPN